MLDLILKANESISEATSEASSATTGQWGDTSNFNMIDSLVVSLTAIAVVFFSGSYYPSAYHHSVLCID